MDKEEYINNLIEDSIGALAYKSRSDIRRDLKNKKEYHNEQLKTDTFDESDMKLIMRKLREAEKAEKVEEVKEIEAQPIDWMDDVLNQVIRMKLTDANRRKEIYDAWEKIHGKYEEMKKTLTTALDQLNEEKEVQEKVEAVRGALEKLPNYIIDFDAIPKKEPTEFDLALQLVSEFENRLTSDREGADTYELTMQTTYGAEGEAQDFIIFGDELEDEFAEELDVELVDKWPEIKVDPLYDLLIDQQIVKTPLKLSTLNKYREDIKRTGEKQVVDWDMGTVDAWNNWIDNFANGVGEFSDADKFYLPLTGVTEKLHGDAEGIDQKTIKFMKLLSDLLMEEKASWQTVSRSLKEGSKQAVGLQSRSGLGAQFTPASKGTPRKIEGLDEALTLFKNYYGAVRGKWYVDVLGEMPSWAKSQDYENIFLFDSGKFNTQVLTSFNKKLIGGMGDLETQFKHLNVIVEFLHPFYKGAFRGGVSEEFYKSIKSKNSKVQRAFKYFIDDLDEIEQFLANALRVKMGESELPEQFKTINGEDVNDLANEWENTPEDILGSLDKALTQPKYLNRYFSYQTPVGKQSVAAITPSNILTIDVNRITGENNRDTKNQRKLFSKLKEFIEIVRGEHSAISKSDINSKLLQAHDLIRKMKGLPIIKAYNSLDNISDMENVISKIETKGYNLTATEVNSIVDAIGAYSDIGRNYGVSEEAVYFAKGMCR